MKNLFTFGVLLTITVFIISCSDKKTQENSLFEEVICDAETISEDGKYFITKDKLSPAKFIGAKKVSTEKAKSGVNSLKLIGKAQFGLNYTVDKVEKGDMFQIEVWKFSSSKKPSLVISAEKSSDFYKKNNKTIEVLENGWEKISMKIIIPFAMDKKKMNIYVWNPDKNAVAYFDDLKISYLGKKE